MLHCTVTRQEIEDITELSVLCVFLRAASFLNPIPPSICEGDAKASPAHHIRVSCF